MCHIPAANENAGFPFDLDRCEFSGLYKPAQIDPRQDLTATPTRVNSSGFGLSSPAPKQPYTKPFSGLPSGRKVTSPFREAGEAHGERPGIVYPLLPRATRPDTRLLIDAATLPESAALSPRSWIWRKRTPERRRTSRHPSLDVSSANAVATARRVFTGHPRARCCEVAGVTKHPPAVNKKVACYKQKET